MKRALLWLPLIVFVGLLAVVASGLFRPADRTIRSAMVGQQVARFDLPGIVPGKAGLSSTDLADGEPRLVNVFASWCAPCVAEAPVLLTMKQAGVRIVGVAVRDTGLELQRFLDRNGDAYERIGDDRDSRVQLSLGSAGVPESFVIDGRGRVVLQHVGEIKPADVAGIVAAIRSAQ